MGHNRTHAPQQERLTGRSKAQSGICAGLIGRVGRTGLSGTWGGAAVLVLLSSAGAAVADSSEPLGAGALFETGFVAAGAAK